MKRKFEFKAQDKETLDKNLIGTSKIRNIVELSPTSWMNTILCLGQLKTLFGEPLYITEDMEDQYAYCILAQKEDGKEVYLHVYSGPSGPAIGGRHDSDSHEAADELAGLITGAGASDYEYEGVYWDGPCIVSEGVRDGAPYYEEEEFTQEKYEKMKEKNPD